jgi:hypothetical protein
LVSRCFFIYQFACSQGESINTQLLDFSGLQQVIDSSLHYVQEKMSTLESQEAPKEDSYERESDENEILNEEAEAITDDSRQNHRLNGVTHVLFSVPIDPLHEEAFSILKKLQVLPKILTVASHDLAS